MKGFNGYLKLKVDGWIFSLTAWATRVPTMLKQTKDSLSPFLYEVLQDEYYYIIKGKYANNQNGNLRWFSVPWTEDNFVFGQI